MIVSDREPEWVGVDQACVWRALPHNPCLPIDAYRRVWSIYSASFSRCNHVIRQVAAFYSRRFAAYLLLGGEPS
jgi:hypothetical protein